MWISSAWASTETVADVATSSDAPSMSQAFLYNAGFIFLIVIMFWLIFIRPQQKRLEAQAEMLNALRKGDKVITAGGLVGKVHKAKEGEREIQVDLGGDQIVTVMRSYLEKATEEISAPLKDIKKDDSEKK